MSCWNWLAGRIDLDNKMFLNHSPVPEQLQAVVQGVPMAFVGTDRKKI